MASSHTLNKAKKLGREIDRLEPFKEQFWLLGEEEINALQVGDEAKIASLLGGHFDNPLLASDPKDIENPHVHLLRLMREPEFFPFTCDRVFNISILPLQHVIL